MSVICLSERDRLPSRELPSATASPWLVLVREADKNHPGLAGFLRERLALAIRTSVAGRARRFHIGVELFELESAFERVGTAHPLSRGDPARANHALDENGQFRA